MANVQVLPFHSSQATSLGDWLRLSTLLLSLHGLIYNLLPRNVLPSPLCCWGALGMLMCIHYLGGDIFGWLDSNGGVPLAWRQHSDLIQELINSRQEIISFFCLICHVMKNLQGRKNPQES